MIDTIDTIVKYSFGWAGGEGSRTSLGIAGLAVGGSSIGTCVRIGEAEMWFYENHTIVESGWINGMG